jgi:hypothetical protein
VGRVFRKPPLRYGVGLSKIVFGLVRHRLTQVQSCAQPVCTGLPGALYLLA